MGTIAERLRYLIDNKKITPYQISIESGIKQATLSRVLNNKTEKLSLNNIALLANYFHISPEWLQTGNGEMHPVEKKPDTMPDLNRWMVDMKHSVDEILAIVKKIESK